jgi:hypothetical protein
MRIALVHWAVGFVRAARHARFRSWPPPCADRAVPGHQAERESESRETVDEPQHLSRMLDWRGGVNERASENRNRSRSGGIGAALVHALSSRGL